MSTPIRKATRQELLPIARKVRAWLEQEPGLDDDLLVLKLEEEGIKHPGGKEWKKHDAYNLRVMPLRKVETNGSARTKASGDDRASVVNEISAIIDGDFSIETKCQFIKQLAERL